MTIGEIAHRCGVSRSTVSCALSGKRPVAEATRQRIVAAADELGYYPARAARPAELHPAGTVGLMVPPAGPTLTPMQLDFVGAVADAAAQAGLDVLVSSSAGGLGGSFERIVAPKRADGVILMEQAGETCMDRILAECPKVTAAVTINESALPGLERALERAGLEMPNQFSITGLVANRWAERCHTRLTAFDVPASEIGGTAVRLPRERITRPGTAPAHELLAPPVAMRDSTGPAAARR